MESRESDRGDATREVSRRYRRMLLDEVIPFWFRNGVDREYGGVLSAMQEDGTRMSTDKYIWSQARWLWVCSALYNRVEVRPEFLEAARGTADFLMKHGQDPEGRWVYATTREGAVLEGATSIFSDCFAVYGLNEYSRASGERQAMRAALETFARVRERVERPGFDEVAPMRLPRGARAHAVPMILTEVANEMARTTGDADIERAAEEYAQCVMDRFVQPEWHALVEYLDWDYKLLAPPEGTAVEPGHAIESMWFVLHWARRRGRPDVIERAVEVIRWHLELGWDGEYGGLFLAVDAKGGTPWIANWDKKLWWPHTEALYALLLAERLTGERWCRAWFERVEEWAMRHFYLPEVGEWRQRLDRAGHPITSLIALPVKDPFHLPRALILMQELG